MSNKNAQNKSVLVELLLMGASLLGSALLLKWSLGQLDPNAGSKKAAKHKKKEIARRLGRAPGSIETNSYEDIIALDVVTHDNLDVEGLDDVGGLEEIKESLFNKVIAPLRAPGLFQSSLLRQAKGVLLYGPPGTGKTMLAKALAAESGACFLNVRASTLQSKWFGDTNKLVTAVFTLAHKLQPSIVFIDEVDALLGKRRDQEHEAVTAMKTEFMQLWDGFLTDPRSNVMVLAATNRPFDLDEAVLRRFSAQFEVPLPDEAQREAILRLTLAKHVAEAGEASVERSLRTNTAGSSGNSSSKNGNANGAARGQRLLRPLAEVAAATAGFSGSDLHELCAAAAAIPVHEYMSTIDVARDSAGFEDASEELEEGGESSSSSSTSGRRRENGSSNSRSSSSSSSSKRGSNRHRSPPPRKPRQLSVADFHSALRTMRPSGEHAAAYRASLAEAAAASSMGGIVGGGMEALAALAAVLGAGGGGGGGSAPAAARGGAGAA